MTAIPVPSAAPPVAFGRRSGERRLNLGGPQLATGILLLLASVAVPLLCGSAYWVHNFTVVNLFVVVAVLQNLLLSDAGQGSFGQGAIFGAAAYMTGIVSGLWGYDFLTGVLAGVAAALVLGILFALPSLRVQGYYLSFVTLSAAIVFPEMLVAFSGVTNGINGIARPVPALARDLGFGLSWINILVLLFAVASLMFHAGFRRTALGRRMRVSATSPEAALTMGSSPGRLRFVAFTIAAAWTGLAGALYVPVLEFVSPYAFRVDLSIFFFFAVIAGGAGRLLGPVIGTWILYLVPNALLADWANYRLLGYGAAAFAIMLLFPDGLVGTLEKVLRRHRTRSAVADIGFKTLLAPGESTASPSAGRDPAITVKGATKGYGRMLALDDASVTIAPRTIHAIVGPNGSGKTTLLNVISGLVRLDRGQILVRDVDTTRRPSHATPRLGVGRTFQTPRVFEEMSVWDNVRIGADFPRLDASGWLLEAIGHSRSAWEAHRPDVLPHAQRRMLEVLRVLAADPDIVLLDEPAAGLSPEERRDFADLLSALRDRWGKTVVLIEHDLHLVWRIADRITVLDAGIVVADGAPAEIMRNPHVAALFTGSAPNVSSGA